MRDHDLEWRRAFMRWQAWQTVFFAALFSVLLLIGLPLRQALPSILLLTLLTVDVVRKHGRRRPDDSTGIRP